MIFWDRDFTTGMHSKWNNSYSQMLVMMPTRFKWIWRPLSWKYLVSSGLQHSTITSEGIFFLGRTFDLVSGWWRICACAVPHPRVLRPLRRVCWIWSSKTTARKTAVVKRAIPQVILNTKELQPITTMYFQWTVNKTGKYKCYGHCSIQVLLSSLEIIVHHIVYSSP